jgi:uncharacterized protein with PQ loop repeat
MKLINTTDLGNPSILPNNDISPQIIEYKDTALSTDQAAFIPRKRIIARYNPKNINMGIATIGAAMISKLTLSSINPAGIYRYPKRKEKEIMIAATRKNESDIIKMNCLTLLGNAVILFLIIFFYYCILQQFINQKGIN